MSRLRTIRSRPSYGPDERGDLWASLASGVLIAAGLRFPGFPFLLTATLFWLPFVVSGAWRWGREERVDGRTFNLHAALDGAQWFSMAPFVIAIVIGGILGCLGFPPP